MWHSKVTLMQSGEQSESLGTESSNERIKIALAEAQPCGDHELSTLECGRKEDEELPSKGLDTVHKSGASFWSSMFRTNRKGRQGGLGHWLLVVLKKCVAALSLAGGGTDMQDDDNDGAITVMDMGQVHIARVCDFTHRRLFT